MSSEKRYAFISFSNTCIETKIETTAAKERRLKSNSVSCHFKKTTRIAAIKEPLNNHWYILKVFFDIGRSSSEDAKLECAARHFEAISQSKDIVYGVVKDYKTLLDKVMRD